MTNPAPDDGDVRISRQWLEAWIAYLDTHPDGAPDAAAAMRVILTGLTSWPTPTEHKGWLDMTETEKQQRSLEILRELGVPGPWLA